MHTHNTRLFLIVGLIVALLTLGGITNSHAEYVVGDTVGDFTLLNWNEQPISLYEQEGKIVLLEFWSFY